MPLTSDAECVPSCRICLETEASDASDRLVRPCACTGTQAYVHVGCLSRWQSTSYSRRFICPVCKTAYKQPYVPCLPPPEPGRPAEVDDQPLGLPWPKVIKEMRTIIAVALLAIACTRWTNPWCFIYLACMTLYTTVQATQRILGLKLCLVVDDDGTPLLHVVRVGSAIDCLEAGALLVATDKIRGGIFDRAVVLITRHDANGTVGYIVNSGFDRMRIRHPAFENGAPLLHALAVPEAPDLVAHGIGGPVGLESWTILHRFENVAGAIALGDGLFVGGDLGSVRLRASNVAEVLGAQEEGPPEMLVRALHGHAAWAPGQLEGEIRSQIWEWAPRLGNGFAMRRPLGRAQVPLHTIRDAARFADESDARLIYEHELWHVARTIIAAHPLQNVPRPG